MNSLKKEANGPRLLSILVVENGAPWPVPELGDDELEIDRVVLAQQVGETQLGFARRVASRVRSLGEHGAAVRLGVIATHDGDSLLAIESRDRIARALIAASSTQTLAGLVLIGRGGRKPRHDLFALAGSLSRSSLEGELYVRVKMVQDVEARARVLERLAR